MMYSVAGLKKYAESKRLIRKAMMDKHLVLFIGAGTSVDAGIPLWKNAIEEIATKLHIDSTKTDVLVVPQYYYNARGKKEYTQLMREIFKYGEKLETKEVHKKIMQFDADTIITTNYDHLLEKAAEENNVFMNVVAKDADLPYRKAGKELIKMHGDFEHDNFVLKEDDYLHYHANFKLIENYVKSLIGIQTVLFIGYSLNDPDVKQIFSWVKEILGEDFQRAYLINAADEFNENVNEYFRHLGVNLIYSSELLEKKDDNISCKLNATLDYLLKDGREELDTTDQIYEDLKPFSELNYTYAKYIHQAISGRAHSNLYINNGIIQYSKSRTRDDEIEFINAIVGAVLGKGISSKIKSIYKALYQSVIEGIVAKDEKEQVTTYTFPNVGLSEYEKLIFDFDIKKLETIKAKKAASLSESDPEQYMQQAAICCFLHDYLSAFNCLDTVARVYYKKNQFSWYFIAQWDKIRVGKIITQCESWNIEEDELKRIAKETKAIDIEKTLLSIPDLGNRNNSFLKDLIDLKFSTSLFSNSFRTSKEIDKESKTTYMLHTSDPAYDKLRQMLFDYYTYCGKNYLFVDRTQENNDIFNLYARTMLASLAAPDIKKEEGEPFASRNYHLEMLEAQDVHYFIRYVESTTLIGLFDEYNIGEIKVSEGCREYLYKVVTVFPDIGATGPEKRWILSYYSRLLVLLSKISLDQEIVIRVLQSIGAIIDTNNLWDLRKETTMFFQNIYKQKAYEDDEVYNVINELTTQFLDLFCDEPSRFQNMWGPIVSLLNCCNASGKPYSNKEMLSDVLNANKVFAVDISPACSDEIHEELKRYFSSEKGKEEISGSSYLYGLLVLYEIIEPDENNETKAIDGIREQRKNEESGMYSYPGDNNLRLFANLLLAGKIINREELVKAIKETNHEHIKWLCDPFNYDYESFRLEWLGEIRDLLIKELAEDKAVSTNIKKAFFKEYYTSTVDQKITDKIMRYFLNDGYYFEEAQLDSDDSSQ